MAVRRIKLGVAVACLVIAAYLFPMHGDSWVVSVIFTLIACVLIFDRGHANTIDETYALVKHLKNKSEQHDLVLMALARQQIRGTIGKLALLKHDYPEDAIAIERAIAKLEKYEARKS